MGDQPAGPYFIILDVAIRDVERYLTYMSRVTPALEAAGGRYLARGGELTTHEGSRPASPPVRHLDRERFEPTDG
jgi:uncharacterized protein (DUF1330 family)